ncbi:MAG: UDP-N-acetylglucosamine 2-epimerase (non-hydrolyzing) [Gammaproteobacteria bacterium]|nr:UDP-N-acetylglucosamine 2-epimerase (non-hydrolyzing) [Gammaproteobacteria bacterium]
MRATRSRSATRATPRSLRSCRSTIPRTCVCGADAGLNAGLVPLPRRAAGAPLAVLAVVGTRPEAIKLAPLLALLAADAAHFALRICATAQQRDLLDLALLDFTLVPDYDLDCMRPDQSLNALTARVVERMDAVLEDARPELVIVHGDTTTALAAALAASHRRVPVAHVEAGLRSFDPAQPFPEETNRVLIDRLATLHFAPTPQARANLLAEGLPAAGVHVTGNTGIDALVRVLAGRPPPVAQERRLLVTCHRRENLGAGVAALCAALATLAAEDPGLAIDFVTHPNPQAGAAARAALAGVPRVALRAPLAYGPMLDALRGAWLVLTDSGGLQEECATLGVPVLVLRERTERPEGIAAGNAELVGTDPDRIVGAVRALAADPARRARAATPRALYGDGAAAPRIAALLRVAAGVAGTLPAAFVPAR